VGLITTVTRTAYKPAPGVLGWMGFGQTTTTSFSVWYPLGVGAASGAACAAGIWLGFAFCCRDPRKERGASGVIRENASSLSSSSSLQVPLMQTMDCMPATSSCLHSQAEAEDHESVPELIGVAALVEGASGSFCRPLEAPVPQQMPGFNCPATEASRSRAGSSVVLEQEVLAANHAPLLPSSVSIGHSGALEPEQFLPLTSEDFCGMDACTSSANCTADVHAGVACGAQSPEDDTLRESAQPEVGPFRVRAQLEEALESSGSFIAVQAHSTLSASSPGVLPCSSALPQQSDGLLFRDLPPQVAT
jgi:hypothetical protein